MGNALYRKFSEAPVLPDFKNRMLLPGYSEVEPDRVDIRSVFVRTSSGLEIPLGLPIIASPMDTVSEVKMAIAAAEREGMAVIHRGCTVEEQIEMIRAVKRGLPLIAEGITPVQSATRLDEALKLMDGLDYGLPVIDRDTKRLIGMLTGKDVMANLSHPSIMVEDAMTVRDEIIFSGPGTTEDMAIGIMGENRIKRLPIVDSEGNFYGLITMKDIMSRRNSKHATRGADGRLAVAACVSPFDLERAKAISELVDALLVDISHFHSKKVIDGTRRIIKETGSDVIIGNLGTKQGVIDSVKALDGRVAGLRMGIGGGSICITTNVTSAGAPALFATLEAQEAVEELLAEGVIRHRIPIIADGGIKGPGDMALCFAAGASVVMLGSGLAATDEAPGGLLIRNGELSKIYRGMGSPEAIAERQAVDRYASASKRIGEGETQVRTYQGSVHGVIDGFEEGLRRSIGIAGGNDIEHLKEVARVAAVDSPTESMAPKIVQ